MRPKPARIAPSAPTLPPQQPVPVPDQSAAAPVASYQDAPPPAMPPVAPPAFPGGPVDVTVWGPVAPYPAASAAVEPPRPKTPGVRHMLLALLTLVLASFVPVIVGVMVVVGSDPDLAADPQQATEQTIAWVSSTGPGLLLSMAATWAALIIPVLVAGRLVQGGWRALVKWKFDWRRDIPIALGFAVIMRVVEIAGGYLLQNVGGVDVTDLGNGDLLTAAGPGWVFGLALAAAIGAPISEELFFRGLSLNVLVARIGKVAAVLVTSLIFGLMHAQGSLAATIYTCTWTAVIGLVLAVLVLRTNRLGTSVLAHAAFNASAVLFLLAG